MKSMVNTRPLLIAATFLFGAQSLQADLIGRWEFEEGTGDTAADLSGTGNTATIFNVNNGLGDAGSVWLNDPTRGAVISFDGTAGGAYAGVGEVIPAMTLDSEFTWAFWANQDPGNTTPNDIIFGNRRNSAGVDFTPRQFIKFTPTKFEFHAEGNGNDNLEYDDLPPSEWIHHAVVKSGGLLTYYRNGVEASTKTITQTLVPQPLFFGGDNTATEGENWRGMLDDVRIFDNALGAGAVNDVFLGVEEGVPGDVNGDNIVNMDDYAIIRDNFRTGQTRAEGNLDLKGTTDFGDFRIWKNAFIAGGGAPVNVPEPATLVLLTLGAGCLALGRSRRR